MGLQISIRESADVTILDLQGKATIGVDGDLLSVQLKKLVAKGVRKLLLNLEDVTQIDLPQGKKSGLIEALEVCSKIEGIGVVQFGERDVVRHNLVQQIIRAYEDYETAHPQRGANGKASKESGKEPEQEIQQG